MDRRQLQGTFASLTQQFEQAYRTTENVIHHGYQFGDEIIRFSFAGTALIPHITTAIAHREINLDQPADLQISLWESQSTGIAIHPPDWDENDYVVRHEVKGMTQDGFFTTLSAKPGRMTMLDTATGRAVAWYENAEALPDWEVATPLLPLLQQWFTHQGLQILHTAAVGDDDGAVLIVGASGAGKSTSTMVCLRDGLTIVGEDYCLLSFKDDMPYVHSLFNIGKLDATSLSWLPEFEDMVIRPARDREGKAMLRLYPAFAEQYRKSLPIRALVIPQVTHEKDTSYVKASTAAALHALAPSTIFQLSGAGRAALGIMAKLVRQIPAYELRLGRDLEQIPVAVQNILHQHREPLQS